MKTRTLNTETEPFHCFRAEISWLKRAGLAVIAIAVISAGCAPLARPPPDALPPAPTELMFKTLGTEADPIVHRSIYGGEQAYNRGDYATAERYYSVGLKRAKEIGNRNLPKALEGYFIAWAAGFLFDAYLAQGKYGEAEQLFRDYLITIEKVNPKSMDYLKKYAALLRSMGREAEAVEIEARAK